MISKRNTDKVFEQTQRAVICAGAARQEWGAGVGGRDFKHSLWGIVEVRRMEQSWFVPWSWRVFSSRLKQ